MRIISVRPFNSLASRPIGPIIIWVRSNILIRYAYGLQFWLNKSVKVPTSGKIQKIYLLFNVTIYAQP